MARHKKMDAAEDEAPGLDISSLIDCCFLLLCYFLVATTMVKEYKLDMTMPGDKPPPEGQIPIDPAAIRVEPSGVVLWGSGPSAIPIETDPEQRSLDQLYERLMEVRRVAEGTGQKPVVLLQVMGNAKNQRVIDVINAIAKAKIDNVALANMKEED